MHNRYYNKIFTANYVSIDIHCDPIIKRLLNNKHYMKEKRDNRTCGYNSFIGQGEGYDIMLSKGNVIKKMSFN